MTEPGALLIDWSPEPSPLAQAFLSWLGDDSDLRVYFTPDVLVGVDRAEQRGYLHNDGWTVEVWVEKGIDALLAHVPSDYLNGVQRAANGTPWLTLERPPSNPSTSRGLLDLVLRKGQPIDYVRDLI